MSGLLTSSFCIEDVASGEVGTDSFDFSVGKSENSSDDVRWSWDMFFVGEMEY